MEILRAYFIVAFEVFLTYHTFSIFKYITFLFIFKYITFLYLYFVIVISIKQIPRKSFSLCQV